MSFRDRALLVVAWLLDSVVFFAALLTVLGVVAAAVPDPILASVVAFAFFLAVVGALAAWPARLVGLARDGSRVVVRNLFRTIAVDEDDVVRVTEGWSASAVHQFGDVAYLVVRRPVRTYLFRRTRIPVHATFRGSDDARGDGARASLSQLLGTTGQ